MKLFLNTLLILLISTSCALADDNSINIKELLKLGSILTDPVIDYCNTNSPSTRTALANGVSKNSEQYNLAFMEWLDSRGDSELTGSKKDFDEAISYFNELSIKLMTQVRQVEPTSYCKNLSEKLLKSNKDSLKLQYTEMWEQIVNKPHQLRAD